MKKFCNWLKWTFKVIITPSCWLQNQEYSELWDKGLLHEMQNNKFVVEADGYYAEIGTLTVWVANHPYASFTPYGGVKVRPSRKTILMAYDQLIKDSLGETKS